MDKNPVDVVAGVIFHGDRLLLHQRKKGDALEGSWEFPGGKVERGEREEEALKREIMEEMDLEIQVEKKLGEVIHEYPHILIRLIAYRAAARDKRLESREGKCLWVRPREVEKFPLSPADAKLWEQIKDALD
jgi:8-oxo-dGTP diphosphatase